MPKEDAMQLYIEEALPVLEQLADMRDAQVAGYLSHSIPLADRPKVATCIAETMRFVNEFRFEPEELDDALNDDQLYAPVQINDYEPQRVEWRPTSTATTVSSLPPAAEDPSDTSPAADDVAISDQPTSPAPPVEPVRPRRASRKPDDLLTRGLMGRIDSLERRILREGASSPGRQPACEGDVTSVAAVMGKLDKLEGRLANVELRMASLERYGKIAFQLVNCDKRQHRHCLC
ncbi:hypothetical protein HK097_006779 [Rhizophlyctis rosea]|uniref:ACB domain-containing protein n=1 Tax=Rhizophlyctis rosea TaxID=64517 RepID=A0AAD5X5X8_9FUNG|nr:hypothetical protein HK097_006779 [Rhizophlyctis rosea]